MLPIFSCRTSSISTLVVTAEQPPRNAKKTFLRQSPISWLSLNLRLLSSVGGPAGLNLGLLLHKHGIHFTIFELRQKPNDEELAKPSGMLDLHEESGIAAIKECGLFEEFLKLTGECSEADKFSDKDGNILHADDGGMSDRPEISRNALTQLLVSHLPTS